MSSLMVSAATFAQTQALQLPSSIQDSVVAANESSKGDKKEEGSHDDQAKEPSSRDD